MKSGTRRNVLLLTFVLALVGGPAQRDASAQEFDFIGPQTGYLVIGPAEFKDELQPLLELRKDQGLAPVFVPLEDVFGRDEPNAEALADHILAVDEGTCGTLSYVFLVGDVVHRAAGEEGAFLPTFYLPKIKYRGWGFIPDKFPSDYPYRGAVREGGDPLMVGRLPARTEDEVRAYVTKLIGYENDDAPGEWQRRALIFAGPANYGPALDALIETFAYNLLERDVPYEFNPRLMFAKPGSPWCFRPDLMGRKIVEEMNTGALFGVYAGHGSPGSFDRIRLGDRQYAIGDAEQMRKLAIENGNPFFIALTCSNGRFDLPRGKRSVAEELVLHPQGTVGTFAAAGISHPYPNALYARAFVDAFLEQRPHTLGEGIRALREGMAEGNISGAGMLLQEKPEELKKEHAALYNLLGDPALRLRYPESIDLEVTVGSALTDAVPGGDGGHKFELSVEADDLPMDEGRAIVTLEVRRAVILEPLEVVPPGHGEDAMEAIARNWDRAQNKIVERREVAVQGGAFSTNLTAGRDMREAVVKVLVIGEDEAAAGHKIVDLTR